MTKMSHFSCTQWAKNGKFMARDSTVYGYKEIFIETIDKEGYRNFRGESDFVCYLNVYFSNNPKFQKEEGETLWGGDYTAYPWCKNYKEVDNDLLPFDVNGWEYFEAYSGPHYGYDSIMAHVKL